MEQNPFAERIASSFEKLVNVMFTLRSDRGCPWDRAQTLKDLRQYLLEESYELLQSLDEENAESMQEELGDLLLQIVFLAQIMQERQEFSLVEILDHLCMKLIERHPHVFGDENAGTPQEALNNWEAVKDSEKKSSGKETASILSGVPHYLPALLQAHLISSKAARIGFEWEKEDDIWMKWDEEVVEFREADSMEKKYEEMGDMLFTLVNIARRNEINSEDALRNANWKFRDRFMRLEKRVASSGKDWKQLTLGELDQLWEEVKASSR